MKKFFKFSLALVLSATLGITSFYSCSSDSSENGTETTFATKSTTKKLSDQDFAEAQQLYKAMTLTPEWSNYATSRKIFSQNMLDNTVFFTSKTEYMHWIHTNLGSTTFNTEKDFETAFDQMTGNYQVLIDNNPVLFKYIENAATDQLYPIMQSGLDPLPEPQGTLPCEVDCAVVFVGEIGEAINNYNLDMEAINTYGQSNLAGAVETRFLAYAIGAVNNLNDCLDDC